MHNLNEEVDERGMEGRILTGVRKTISLSTYMHWRTVTYRRKRNNLMTKNREGEEAVLSIIPH